MIDIHTHIGRIMYGERFLKPAELLQFMDRNRIEKAVVLPIENPEELDYYVTTEEVLRAYRRYPDRIIPFCNVDPRHCTNDGNWDPTPIITEYVDQGCRGFGEVLANMRVDDNRMQRIYQVCGKLGLPITIHFGKLNGLYDEIGLPHFEEMLKKYPQTIFLGHAVFWYEIFAQTKEDAKPGYPKEKIIPGGQLDRLFSIYPNLYGDLSANSGYYAISRDPEFGKAFLERHAKQLLFGTDYLRLGQETPIIEFLKHIGLDKKTYQAIVKDNAKRILKF
ncbi:MAG: amidohydrolase family protein [Syntrophales bacterium]|nr:amidohydrolase family protein [Syntrophales bacterium]